MEDSDFKGRIVFLTVHLDKWLRDINPKFNVPMSNRLAKVVKVFDWSTEEGKLLLDVRKKTGKWEKLNPQDFKFILKVYHPDLKINKNDNQGMMVEEVLPLYFPGTKLRMFDLYPERLLRDINKKEKNSLKVIKKDTDVPG
jgi:hypothetical protein